MVNVKLIITKSNNNHNKAFNNRKNDNEKNRSNTNNSNNNDLKDGQNGRLEKKETLTWTKNWSGIYTKNIFYWRLQALHGKQFKKKRPKVKSKKQWDI